MVIDLVGIGCSLLELPKSEQTERDNQEQRKKIDAS
jgi:hypothetical protein